MTLMHARQADLLNCCVSYNPFVNSYEDFQACTGVCKPTTFMEQIKHQADIAMTEADVIVFVVSGKEGVTDADEYVSKILYRTNKPVILVVNKVDNPEMRSDIYDFYSLGLGDPYPVSSVHGIGTGDVLDAIVENLPVEEEDENPDIIKFSLIGRPNVGKSSLINAILGEERVIASPIAGTTRDAIDTNFTDSEGQEYTMIDTAGMRKSGKVYENTEKYSVMRSMRAIDRSDIVLMVINAEEGIREYDKRIAGFAHEAGKGIIIVVNKWDTIEKDNHTVVKWEEKLAQAKTNVFRQLCLMMLSWMLLLSTQHQQIKGNV